MIVKAIIIEDFTNYKKPCMVIGMPHCSFKCDKECGKPVCQNSELAKASNKCIGTEQIIQKYLNNSVTQAICFQGLEPMDSYLEVRHFISVLRSKQCLDDVVIYTGYTEEELSNQIQYLRQYKNIIIKFGRFIPDQKPHYDEILGVNLASDNQYAKKIS